MRTEPLLRSAARAWGIQSSYRNMEGREIQCAAEVLAALLETLSGVPVTDDSGLEEAFALRFGQIIGRGIEPVIVAWGGRLEAFDFRLARSPETPLSAQARFEIQGREAITREWDLSMLRPATRPTHVRYRIPCALELPTGYHRLRMRWGSEEQSAHLISAPQTAWLDPRAPTDPPSWGVFSSTFAMRSRRDRGVGSLKELGLLQEYVIGAGGRWVGTLPMLAQSWAGVDPDPSPYSPLSRLFYNELLLDVDALLAEQGLEHPPTGLSAGPMADYKAAHRNKKALLQDLSDRFFSNGREDLPELRGFLAANPLLEEFTRFVCECAADAERTRRYHLYCQFQMDRQLRALARRSRETGHGGLYLDLPLGVSKNGFDEYRFRSQFLAEYSAGSPPDPLFPLGQNWGFSPPHPIHCREEGYGYFRRVVAFHLRHARALRIDHVMGLHRLFCVPPGAKPGQGTYVKYQSDELFAILAVESQRAQAEIVGEDLGTVPDIIRERMDRHRIRRMWVLQLELEKDPPQALSTLPPRAVVSLNTHDMPPFAGFLEARELDIWERLGIFDADMAREARRQRERWIDLWRHWLPPAADPAAPAAVEYLRSLARALPRDGLLLISLEDLWGEVEPLNVPGTTPATFPNWRRRHGRALEDWSTDLRIQASLRRILGGSS